MIDVTISVDTRTVSTLQALLVGRLGVLLGRGFDGEDVRVDSGIIETVSAAEVYGMPILTQNPSLNSLSQLKLAPRLQFVSGQSWYWGVDDYRLAVPELPDLTF